MKKRKLKRKEHMEQIVGKMQHMIGLGPLVRESVLHFEKAGNNSKATRKLAAEEYLQFYLDFNKEEINELDIQDTK